MNCPEKIAGTYLRLNGFFPLPHFTLFDGNSHTHVDFLALRSPGGRERCRGQELPLDLHFFRSLDKLIPGGESLNKLLGAIIEVKGGYIGELPSDRHLHYARDFFGPEASIFPLSFSQEVEGIRIKDEAIAISLQHSLNWVVGRIRWMNDNVDRLTKTGSWTWSEAFLSDLLYLQGLGFLKATTICQTTNNHNG